MMDAGPVEVVAEEVGGDVVTTEGEREALVVFNGMGMVGET